MRVYGSALCFVVLACVGCDDELGNSFTGPTRETHDRYFPILSGPHAVDCNDCHGAFDTFKQFDCLSAGCHAQTETDMIHSGFGDYSYDSPACYDCHPRGSADDAVDHARFFPISAGEKHAGNKCVACHRDPATRTNITCFDSTCHQTPAITTAHSNVGGYQADSSLCIRCHADSQVDPTAQHLPFRILSGKHARRSCLQCHPARRADKPFAEDFVPFDCYAGCHSKADAVDTHRGMSGFDANNPQSCVQSQCHADGSKP